MECRIGPHPVKGWAAGRVIKHFYMEPNWPPNMVAPYQIALHDGRLIFAPADNDNVIRRRYLHIVFTCGLQFTHLNLAIKADLRT